MHDAPTRRCFRRESPLTTPDKIHAFLDKVTNLPGIKKAKRAAKYIIPNSASPMETVQALMLGLPCALGGYGFEAPLLNHRINLPSKKLAKTRGGYYVVDAYWPAIRLAIEYDSDEWHTRSERICEDATRRNALESMGITVITVTRKQLLSETEMDKVADIVAKRLRKRVRPGASGHGLKKAELRKQLLAATASDLT